MAGHENQSHILHYVLTFYLDDRTTTICTWILYSVLCQIINVFGVITNIINIICFVKQGFKEPTNISLLGLSVSDLGSLVTMCCTCVFTTPAFVEANLPFESLDVQYLFFVMPHFAFTRVSSCITALISLERCLSIVAPLKVRHIITPKRAGINVIAIFIIFIFSATPIYAVNRLGNKYSFSRNKTIIALIFSANKELVEMFTYFINNFFIPFCAFIIVTVCTVILTAQLHTSSEWRKTTINIVQAQKMSSRNKKVAKMVVAISALFISCFVPISIIMLGMAFVPEMSIHGKFFNAAKILAGFTFILESINSSINIFIYHHMSSKYRDTFKAMFIRTHKCTS